MKMTKKIGSGGVGWARKESYEYEDVKYEADLKDGDIVTILDEGVIQSSNYNGRDIEQQVFKIKTRNGEKRLALNQKTINVLIDSFGEDSKDWIDEDVNVILVKKMIAGKKAIIPYLTTKGWSLDEYGELIKEGNPIDVVAEKTIEKKDEDLKVEDIPF